MTPIKRIILLLLLPAVAFTQEKIDVQRPTLTESSTIIDKKIIQSENGIVWSEHRPAYSLFMRFGLDKHLELRMFTDLRPAALNLSGKLLLYEGKGAIPGVAFTANIDLFFDQYISDARLCLTNGIGESPLFYTINAGVAPSYWLSSKGQWYGIALLGCSIGEKLNVFAEYQQYEEGKSKQLNAGLTFIPNGEMQFDIHGGLTGLQDYYVGTGFAFRLKE